VLKALLAQHQRKGQGPERSNLERAGTGNGMLGCLRLDHLAFGGLVLEAEMKGHVPTTISFKPLRLFYGFTRAGVKRDKNGRSYRGTEGRKGTARNLQLEEMRADQKSDEIIQRESLI